MLPPFVLAAWTNHRQCTILSGGLILVLAIFATTGTIWYLRDPERHRVNQICAEQYPLITQEVDCGEIAERAEKVENIQAGIESYIKSEKQAGHADRISIFFRDLRTRRWFGVHETEVYFPASLIKLPLAVMYYKISEYDIGILERPLVLESADRSRNSTRYTPDRSLTAGQEYSVRELIRQMLVYSDNSPLLQLGSAVPKDFYAKLMADIGVYTPPGKDQEERWIVNPRSYANIFRFLYNASYLDIENSQAVLDLLTETKFHNGLVAGVPKDVGVAHKFGEATVLDREEKNKLVARVLSDCGIVYKPDNPYIICIMTEGKEFEKLEEIIGHLSREVYESLKD